MSACEAGFKIDTDKLSSAIKELEACVKDCNKQDLEALNEAGYLPTGIKNYLSLFAKD